MALADCVINYKDFSKTIWEYGRRYPNTGYGSGFKKWLNSPNPRPYESFVNVSAMRVSAIGASYDSIENVLDVAAKSASVSHNRLEGIKGVQAIATAIFLTKNGKGKRDIKAYISYEFGYNLNFTLDDIRDLYSFDVSCQGSVPQEIVAFLESNDFEHAIRLAISIGGDSDTIACMTGGIASAHYNEIPQDILKFVLDKLPKEFIEILETF